MGFAGRRFVRRVLAPCARVVDARFDARRGAALRDASFGAFAPARTAPNRARASRPGLAARARRDDGATRRAIRDGATTR